MKPYILFINVIDEENNSYRFGWKHYRTPENAIQAFKDIRKGNFMNWQIGEIAEISGNGAKTIYGDI